MASGEDDPLFQIAINESVQPEVQTTTSGQVRPADQDVNEAAAQDSHSRVTIDDMIGRLASRATAELPGFDEADGDTWVFIDAAPKQPEQDQVDYEHYVKRCSAPIRLNKATLMRLNSPPINSAFGPTFQYRLLRRRKLVDKLPEGIKHVIDLTPPNEGDDAVWLISSLSCSEGVRLWYHSQQLLAVSPQLVAGEEEYTSAIPNLNGGRIAPRAISRNGTRHSTIAPEYSPLRHRAAIERLLAAAAGADPKLDSAPKLWTTFAVAKHLGVVGSPLTDYIVTWLRAHPNCMFLEVLTEASHIMADHLQVHDLARDTFAMLVGEEALDSIVRYRNPQNSRMSSTFGRKKEGLPEHIQTRVEYASKAFIDRMVADFEDLKCAKWIESLDEYKRLSSLTHPDLQYSVSLLKIKLDEWMRGTISHVRFAKYEVIPGANTPPGGGEDLIPRCDRKAIFESLSNSERILTRTFWNALETFNLFDGASNLDIVSGWEGTAVLATRFKWPYEAETGYCKVKRTSLQSIIIAGEAILRKLKLPSLQAMNIPDADAEKPSDPYGSSSFVPLEVAHRFPLATRPILPLPRRNADGGLGKGSVSSPALISESTWPAPDGLAEWAAQEKGTGASDSCDVRLNHSTGNEALNDQLSLNKENFLPKMETDEDEEDALANWGESLQVYNGHGQDALESSDTTPLLMQAKEPLQDDLSDDQLSYDQNILCELDQTNRKHGTKRTAETHEPKPSTTTESPMNWESYILPPKRSQFFDLSRFFDQAEQHIRLIARLKLSYTDVLNGRNEPHKLELINTLVCLDDPEFKYLPLWAGGCDDESGGVFNDEVAMPDVSFATAGPSINHGAAMHTVSECDTVSENGVPRGIATPTSSVPSSEYHLVNEAASTVVPSSNQTTAGYFSDTLDSDHVYAADSVDGSSASGDDFSLIARSEGMDPDDEEENARRQIEAMELAEAAEAEAAMESTRARASSVHDENYADLFGSEDGDEEDDDGNASDDTMQGLGDDDEDDKCGREGELI